MNSERLTHLADVIEAHPDNFDMGYWIVDWDDRKPASIDPDLAEFSPFDCGTRCCVGGWTAFLWPDLFRPDLGFGPSAARVLDLDSDQEMLFFETEMELEPVVDQLRSWAAGNPACLYADFEPDEDEGDWDDGGDDY